MCALNGDCIYDVVQDGALEIEKEWEKIAKPWNLLIDKAVKGRFMGLGSPVVDRRWLSYVLFQPTRVWPSRLSDDEKQLLELARAAAMYHSLADQGVEVDTIRGDTTAPDKIESDAATLKAMQKYAALIKQHIALPMYRVYDQVAQEKAKEIMPMCQAVYGESCSEKEAIGIFKGDLQRGWKLSTLMVSPTTERVLRPFLKWISA